ncbi:hypothetical protein F7R01_13425 [Pseudomonas argentinensis]|uniref:Uncharacterized protein n=1 Tax=Phytopseudomonas argentinensis TaxID=289370 RepID=A0A1I3HDY4_9GAMM|nr:hypothetical protein [Pseudomonas argentinensis]KAB0548469.1 hypothetical protein F7R01_13425 [Pseudomonas argentinensis]SFI33988.1 hypothetical protein SAMN05216602_0829 [Pseudomonas argentinensis]
MDLLISWFEAHSGTAGWMQAFGGLIGLAIAIYLPHQQHVKALKQAGLQRHERSLQLFDALGAMANFAGQSLLNVLGAMESPDFVEELPYAYQPSELEGLATAFSSYPLHELPDHDSVQSALLIKSSFSHASKKLSEAFSAVMSGDLAAYIEHKDVFEFYYNELCEHVTRFSDLADGYRKRLQDSE